MTMCARHLGAWHELCLPSITGNPLDYVEASTPSLMEIRQFMTYELWTLFVHGGRSHDEHGQAARYQRFRSTRRPSYESRERIVEI